MDETAYEHLHENPSVCGEDFWKIKQTLKVHKYLHVAFILCTN